MRIKLECIYAINTIFHHKGQPLRALLIAEARAINRCLHMAPTGVFTEPPVTSGGTGTVDEKADED